MTEPIAVPETRSLEQLFADLRQGGRQLAIVVDEHGGLAGIVTLSDVQRVAREDWPAARVTDIMTRYDSLARVGPDDPLDKALEMLQEREVNQLPVVEPDGRTVVGLLTRSGVLRLVDTRMKLGV
jgi:CBS domain containing-hemolysin-like protein